MLRVAEPGRLSHRRPCVGSALCRETFPLLMDPVSYSPDTLDIWSNRPEMDYWLSILGEQVDNIVEKAIASEGNSPGDLIRLNLRRKLYGCQVHMACRGDVDRLPLLCCLRRVV